MWVQYYDVIADGASTFYFALAGVPFLFIGFFLLLMGFRRRKETALINDKSKKNTGSLLLFGFIMTVFSCFWIFGVYFSTKNEYAECEKIINNNSYKIIEGRVENFVPQREKPNQKPEKFSVKDIPFEYLSYNVSIGYHQSKNKGGVIDSGKYVRIHYYEGQILRLWVLEETKK